MRLDLSMEKKTRVGEIVRAVSDWSRERNLVFMECSIDGANFYLDSVPDMDINNVGVLNCRVQSKADLIYNSIDEGMRYCTRVLKFIDEDMNDDGLDKADIENMAAGMAWLKEAVCHVMGLLDLNPQSSKYLDRMIDEYLEDLETLRQKIEGVDSKADSVKIIREDRRCYAIIRDILSMLLESNEMNLLIVQSVDSPDILVRSLAELKEGLAEQIKNVEGAAVLYQTGKDQEASAKLESFVDYMYRYTRTCHQVQPIFNIDLSEININGKSLAETNALLMDRLHNLLDVMEHNDIISLSDILEYEIRPLMDEMGAYVDILLDKVG
jgi:hypothetical protein